MSRRNNDPTGGLPSIALLGAPRRPIADLYHRLLAAGWPTMLGASFAVYGVVNLLFASLYWLEGNGIEGMETFPDALWFSVQTFSTIGYGALSPVSFWANLLVLFESFAGLLGTALMAAILFAKLSRPSARVAFSEQLVVHNRDGQPTLQFRIANERRNQILDASLQLVALVEEKTSEGQTMRRFRNLTLEREHSPLFAVNWTAIHPLSEDSPLFNLSRGDIDSRVVFILATFTGTDDTFVQTVHASKVYTPKDVRFGQRFADMIEHTENEVRLHYRRLNALTDSADTQQPKKRTVYKK